MMSTELRILIVEDDPTLLRVVSDNFNNNGYQIATATDGEIAIEKAMSTDFDLLVLDVMLPKVNGYEVCRHLRSNQVESPIIFLTAKSEESDILLGLGVGGDDYLCKPFSIKELLARVEAVLRRSGSVKNQVDSCIPFGKFELDTSSHQLRTQADGKPIKLSPKEYDLLAYLIEHAGEALSRQRIMDHVWGYESRVTFRSIDRFITTLRKKLASDSETHIETVREFGYRFRT